MASTLRAAAAAAFLVCLCVAPGARAQATRTWVSGTGDDANPCSRTAPCKTFPGAYSKTAVGGEIDALDPGGFGMITISKSITIDGGSFGSILASGTPGLTIIAGATDVVVLRGISFQGVHAGTSGIRYVSGGAVHVENCLISGFVNKAIEVTTSGNAALFVKNTSMTDNGPASGSNGGIFAAASGGATAQVTIDKSSITGSYAGVDAGAGAKVTLHDSVISGNSGYGIHAEAGAEVNMERGVLSNNGVGMQSEGTSRISNVMVSDNVTGLATGGTGTIGSFGNNRIAAGNTTNGTPTATLPQQ